MPMCTKELLVLVTISVIVAFAANFVSPKGIALFGEWDVSQGVITAKPHNDAVVRELEIDSIPETREIYNKGDTIFLDSRSSDMFEEGHIAGAVSLPVYEFESYFVEFSAIYPVSTPIITYCSGRECEDSHVLAQYLMEREYSNVRVFIDGYPGWAEKGFPIEPQH